MIATAKKKDKILFLVIPLLIVALTFFAVYASSISVYYTNYEDIISNSFPDYMIFKENSTIFNNPDFSKEIVRNVFSLDDYECMGYIKSEIKLGQFNKTKFAIIWATSSYYKEHSNLTLNVGEFLIQSSLQNEYFNDSSEIYCNFELENGYEINETLYLVNFIQKKEIFVSQSLMDVLVSEFDDNLLYVFMNDETFSNLFLSQIDLVTTYNLFLFQFKKTELFSIAFNKITDFLKTKENQLNIHFEYQSVGIEFIFQQELLREKLIRFENENRFFEYLQLPLVFILVGIFNVVLLTISARTYINNQSEGINLFRIRGGKKSEIYKMFLLDGLKIALYSYPLLFLISFLFLLILVPTYLKFSLNYLNLIGSLLLIIIISCAYQIIIQLRSLQRKKLAQETNKSLMRSIRTFFKEIGILSIPSAISILVFIIFTGTLIEFEKSIQIWQVFIYFPIILVFSYFLTKDTFIKMGGVFFSLLTRKNKLFKFTRGLSKDILMKRNSLSKLITVFILLLSLSFSVVDSYNRYLTQNNEFNQISDITISYPISSRFRIENNLSPYVNNSVEILHFQFIKETVSIEGGQIIVDGYCINSSKINYLFNIEELSNKYPGDKTTQEVGETLLANNRTMIISQSTLFHTNKNVGDNFSFYLRERSKYYSGQIIDKVKVTPLFSWLTKNYYSGNRVSSLVDFIILNSDFEVKLQDFDNIDIISILNLKENVSTQQIRDLINQVNSMEHLGIEIIDFTQIKFFDEDFRILLVTPEFRILIIILIGIALYMFLLENSNQLFKEQIEGYRVFFARGLSLKRGSILALVPILIFLLFLVLFGIIFGWIFSSMILSLIQPMDSLKIQFTIFPFTLIFIISIIITIFSNAILIGISNYTRMRKHIPTVSYSESYIHLIEGV